MYSSDDADLYSFHIKATFISETVNMDTSVSLQCTDIYIPRSDMARSHGDLIFIYVYRCMHHMCAVSMKTNRGQQIPWSWSQAIASCLTWKLGNKF